MKWIFLLSFSFSAFSVEPEKDPQYCAYWLHRLSQIERLEGARLIAEEAIQSGDIDRARDILDDADQMLQIIQWQINKDAKLPWWKRWKKR